MISNEAIVRTSSGSEALEGLTVPEEICDLALDCLEGNTSFDDAIRMIVARYSEMPDVIVGSHYQRWLRSSQTITFVDDLLIIFK